MKKYIYFALVLILLLTVYLIIENKRIRIVHNDTFGKDNKDLIEKVKQSKPDMIFLTGDLIDKRRTDMDVSIKLVEQLVAIADCYYIAGNHESVIADYDYFQKKLEEIGVNVINDAAISVGKINIYGIKDYNFFKQPKEKNEEIISQQLAGLEVEKKEDEINILLVHRPHYFDIYCQYQFDYIFAGHVHGGQMRLPFVGGVYGPNQGLFPKYDCGLYQKDKTKMIISAGLGNSLFPLRIFDNPQIVVVDISANSLPE